MKFSIIVWRIGRVRNCGITCSFSLNGTSSFTILIVACLDYEALKKELTKAMLEEDRAHSEQVTIPKVRAKRLQDARHAVNLVEQSSHRHVQECGQCKAEGNQPLKAMPM